MTYQPETKKFLIETAEEAAVFPVNTGEQWEVEYESGHREWSDGVLIDQVGTAYPARYTCPEVLAAITPVENADPQTQVRVWTGCDKDAQYPWIMCLGRARKLAEADASTVILVDNALTHGTIGKLRELLRQAKGEV